MLECLYLVTVCAYGCDRRPDGLIREGGGDGGPGGLGDTTVRSPDRSGRAVGS